MDSVRDPRGDAVRHFVLRAGGVEGLEDGEPNADKRVLFPT